MDKMHWISVVYGVTMVMSVSNSPSMVMPGLQQFGCLNMSGPFLLTHVPNSLKISGALVKVFYPHSPCFGEPPRFRVPSTPY
jgi:hypothetical protein